MSSQSDNTISDLFRLDGKTAFITGATGHLGKAMARALAEAGASVVVASRSLDKAQSLLETLPAVNKPHHAVELDHMDEASIISGYAKGCELAGTIDVLINNGNEALGKDWSTVTGEEFRRQLDNLTGYFLLAREFRNHVVSNNASGSLILLGSMYGLVGSYPDAYAEVCPASPVSYHAMKGGVVQMTRHLAVYWASDNIRVNCLCPGPFPTEHAPQEMVRRLKEKSPMKRMGTPEEIKGPIVYLASNASSYTTGQNLVIDGGWTAW
ncbi:SDR family NAD(P)-dependent oxidoreductase [Planctomicrobium sp. SH527]|uniref:SDR family NAD(P)-dependent oxidoreductase n=1 Tax=Planctomicrobium sp. SH527 TaxID=3448123 RepID=UPI003F5B6682